MLFYHLSDVLSIQLIFLPNHKKSGHKIQKNSFNFLATRNKLPIVNYNANKIDQAQHVSRDVV